MNRVILLLILLLASPAFAAQIGFTVSGTWAPPADFPTSHVATKLECVANGGTGSLRRSSSLAGAAGGAGEYAAETNVTITGTPAYVIGTSAGPAQASFPASVTVTCNPGGNATTSVPGVGGTGSTNTTHHDGGSGGQSGTSVAWGGGGAAGPTGVGGNSTSAVGGTGDGGTVAGGSGGAGNIGTEWSAIGLGVGSGGAGAASTGNGFAGASCGAGGGAHGTATGGTAAAAGLGCIIVTYVHQPPMITTTGAGR